MVGEVKLFKFKLSKRYSILCLCLNLQNFEKKESFDILNLVFEISNLKPLNFLQLSA